MSGDEVETFTAFDNDFYRRIRESVDEAKPLPPSDSSFWPPVKHEKFFDDKESIVCDKLSFVVTDRAFAQFLSGSDIYKLISNIGVGVEITQSPPSSSNCIYAFISSSICPTKDSYDIQVGDGRVVLVGYDCRGLIYAFYTFYQLLKHHCESKVESGRIQIPAVAIRDVPDISVRGVMLSVRQLLRNSASRTKDKIELLLRMRINSVYMVYDQAGSCSDAINKFCESCGAVSIDAVPVLVVNSIHQW